MSAERGYTSLHAAYLGREPVVTRRGSAELGESPATRRHVESDALFQGDRELVIVHAGKEYVLRITRQGKLILTT
jgi:hemin uptake protein HemP